MEVLQLRRAAEDELQRALQGRCQTAQDLDRLHRAVEECRRPGIFIGFPWFFIDV